MENSTPPLSILLILCASVCGAAGSYLYKTGAKTAAGLGVNALLNAHVLGGVACYTCVMVLFVSAFRNGGSLTVLYPAYASTFIFSAIIALVAYGTPIRAVNVLGMALLVAGMYMMGRQS